MDKRVTFEEMRIDDYDEILLLWQSIKELGVYPAFDTRERICAYLERNQGLSTVAKCDGKIVGTVLCGHDGRRGSIYHVGVLSEYRGRGIAQQMLARSIGCLKTEGINAGYLFVHSANEKAAQFWQSQGWTPAPNIVYYYNSF